MILSQEISNQLDGWAAEGILVTSQYVIKASSS
jgi:hypothetical protein